MITFCSWSGGKDSCLSLYRALRRDAEVHCLFNMLSEDGSHSRSHGLSRHLLELQADALEIPIEFGSATWEKYEDVFLGKLADFRSRGIEAGVFGDIDIEEHRQWVERVCAGQGIEPLLPLWQAGRIDLLNEFVSSGFKALIVTVKEAALDESWLGRTLDTDMVEEFTELGIDASGERGEYHTFVYDGPIYKERVLYKTGGITKHGGYCFLNLGCG